MGRELKRVALDFDWPLNKTWKGFINDRPHTAVTCSDCEGTGYSKHAKHLSDQWYGKVPFDPAETGSKLLTVDSPPVRAFAERNVDGDGGGYYYRAAGTRDRELAVRTEAQRLIELWNNMWMHHLNQADVDALIAEDRLCDLTSTWSKKDGWKKKENVVVTAEQVNAWGIGGMGHDSINSGICIEARCKREGQPYLCSKCNGDGSAWPSKAEEEFYDAWEETEPPAGEGYQIWETVSEGSPVSPVFASPEDLACWMVNNDNSVTRDTTYGGWLKFIKGPGWAPSAIGNSQGISSGVAATCND
jgi:hypothetical protein